MSSDSPVTSEPPHIVAANAGHNVAALAMAPLPEGAGSHAEAAINHLKSGNESQAQANNISGGGKKKKRGVKRTRSSRRSSKGKTSRRKSASKKRNTKTKRRSRSSKSKRKRRTIKTKK